jgi:D-alanine-D-alanine ligase
MTEKTYNKVAVLKGGISSEREISLKSGAAIAQGLRDGGYDVTEIDVESKEFTIPEGIEAVFVALHGLFGEDGGIQQILKEQGIPFTGSGVDSSRTSFDKVLTRDCLEENGVPVPRGEIIEASEERTIPVPLVVKPSREGSSVGVHIVMDEGEWEAAYTDAAAHAGEVLVEAFIPGREMTVGVVNGQVMPVVEIKPNAEWYDFEAKYVTGDTAYVCPAEIDEDLKEQLQSIALATFDALGAEGFGRVDFRVTPDDTPYVLELNAIPGFTATSLLPKAAQAAGIGFSELCCLIMESARVR